MSVNVGQTEFDKKIARNISVSKYLQSLNFFDTSPIAEKKQQIRTHQSVVS